MSARLALAALSLAALACGPPIPFPWDQDGGFSLCSNDNECSQNQVCYVDGCGDPGENLAVEVVPQTGGAQDFPIAPGALRPEQMLDLFPPAALHGGIFRSTLAGPQPYLGAVSVSIRGESTVIPGLNRRYESSSPEQSATYSLQLGTGTYTVTARADSDPNIPPVVMHGVKVEPGADLELSIVFPGDLELVHLSGRIVRTQEAPEPVQASLDVQVLDLESREVLSQRVPVSSTGDFAVAFSYPRSYLSSVLLQVTPRDPSAMVPRRVFTVSTTSETLEQPLAFGDYGAPVTARGVVLDADGEPVEGARVNLSGEVNGGGSLQSATATTTADGSFSLQTLAGDPENPMRLSIVPPPTSAAAITVVDAAVPYAGGDIGAFNCTRRVSILGRVLRPDTTPASGVRVVATPASRLEEFPLPSAAVETKSDANGDFQFTVDPAVYRLDLYPGENLPRVSRFAAVGPVYDSAGAPVVAVLPSFILSSGRTVKGSVTIRQQGVDGGTSVAAPNATIRFFRVTPLNGKPGALLLAEGVSDANGQFQVVLPTR